MSRRRCQRLLRLLPLLGALVVLGTVVPRPSVQPAAISLRTVENVKAVDFDDGVLWVLVLGSDARPGQPVTEGRTDAIQLVGLNWLRGSAVSIGIPRDSWLPLALPEPREDRINVALSEGGTDAVAEAVAGLVGISPDLVLVTGFEGFEAMVTAVDGVRVESPVAFPPNEHGLVVRRGPNDLDPEQALAFARLRQGLVGDDLARAANHQRLMLAVLDRLRAQEDDEGFMEAATLAGLQGLETDLDPLQLYRLAQALTTIDPRRTTACVVGGTPFTTDAGAQVLQPDVVQARALGDDAAGDARLQGGCRTG